MSHLIPHHPCELCLHNRGPHRGLERPHGVLLLQLLLDGVLVIGVYANLLLHFL